MTFLDEESLAKAMTDCYERPRSKAAIVFTSEEHFAEFSDTLYGMANANQIVGVSNPPNGGEYELIEFKNGSYIRLLHPQYASESFWAKEREQDFDTVIYDYDQSSYELEDFLGSFQIKDDKKQGEEC